MNTLSSFKHSSYIYDTDTAEVFPLCTIRKLNVREKRQTRVLCRDSETCTKSRLSKQVHEKLRIPFKTRFSNTRDERQKLLSAFQTHGILRSNPGPNSTPVKFISFNFYANNFFLTISFIYRGRHSFDILIVINCICGSSDRSSCSPLSPR